MRNCSNWGCCQTLRKEDWDGNSCGCWRYYILKIHTNLHTSLLNAMFGSVLNIIIFSNFLINSIFKCILKILSFNSTFNANLHPNCLNAMFGSILNIVSLKMIIFIFLNIPSFNCIFSMCMNLYPKPLNAMFDSILSFILINSIFKCFHILKYWKPKWMRMLTLRILKIKLAKQVQTEDIEES